MLSPLKRHGFCTNVELFDEYNVTSSEGTYRFWIKDTLLDYFIIPWCSCITMQLFKQYNLLPRKSERSEGELCSSRRDSFHEVYESFHETGISDEVIKPWDMLAPIALWKYIFLWIYRTQNGVIFIDVNLKSELSSDPWTFIYFSQESSVQSVTYHHLYWSIMADQWRALGIQGGSNPFLAETPVYYFYVSTPFQ